MARARKGEGWARPTRPWHRVTCPAPLAVTRLPGRCSWPSIPSVGAGGAIRRAMPYVSGAGGSRVANGSRSRTRTYDRAINSRLLYQLSYSGSPDGPYRPAGRGGKPPEGLRDYGAAASCRETWGCRQTAWCGWPDLNRQGLSGRRILSSLWLPFHHTRSGAPI